MKSLDPRVNRLPDVSAEHESKKLLDQLTTFEVFVQPRDGKPFQHEGIVHAPDVEMAFILAKESLTRRFQCVSLFVTDTRNVTESEITEGEGNAYDLIEDVGSTSDKEKYEVFHLLKRGKQHVHAGNVESSSAKGALSEAKKLFGSTKANNVWVIPSAMIRYTSPEEKDLWITLPDKKFRDASNYKGGDKLKEFLEKRSMS